MKVEYINPFVRGAYSILEATIGIRPDKGELSVRTDSTTSQQCTIVIGVTGQLAGTVTYGMKLVAADKIASLMLGRPVKTFDQLAASAVAELAEMMCGHALTELAENGFVCDTSPPSIVRGINVKISSRIDKALVIPLRADEIEVELCVSLDGAQVGGLSHGVAEAAASGSPRTKRGSA